MEIVNGTGAGVVSANAEHAQGPAHRIQVARVCSLFAADHFRSSRGDWCNVDPVPE